MLYALIEHKRVCHYAQKCNLDLSLSHYFQ